MIKKFYLTTTLPYVNAAPHLGFALEMVQADTLARFHRLKGDEVFFNTGTDEHGLKIYRQALAEKKQPQDYVDEYAAKYDRLKTALNLTYNNFIRTTDKNHLRAAKEFWQRCQSNGDIYQAKQKISYCVGCELEKTDSELIEGQCPIHPNKKLEIIEEKNYFFRFSRYQERLLNLYQKNSNFVIPKSKFREIKNFVSQGLKDFSISRLKTKMPWGIETPNDKTQVIYVWFDALINYVAAIGWPDNIKEFKKWWPVTQLAGKDNLRQQAAMWQAMLLSAGLPNSQQIFIHSFITSSGQKMSKSLGNVIDPFELVKKYGVDPVRYYLLREIPPYQDGDFSYSRFEQLYNADLANGLGNLVQRLSKLAEKVTLKKPQAKPKFKIQNYPVYHQFLTQYRFNNCLEWIWQKISKLDHFIDQSKPWELVTDLKDKKLDRFLEHSLQRILEISLLLEPFLPETAQKIEKIFASEKIRAPKKPLFPRI